MSSFYLFFLHWTQSRCLLTLNICLYLKHVEIFSSGKLQFYIVCLYLYYHGDVIDQRGGCHLINWFNPVTLLCLSLYRAWISNLICVVFLKFNELRWTVFCLFYCNLILVDILTITQHPFHNHHIYSKLHASLHAIAFKHSTSLPFSCLFPTRNKRQ